MLTQARLKKLLCYDSETGIFVWLVGRKVAAGDRAGTLVNKYIRIKVDGKSYAAHRLAVLYMTGNWPVTPYDHINLQKDDNRWCNLREATLSQNQANRGVQANNKLRLKGVYSVHKRYRASISVGNVQHHLGYFDCPAAAHLAYVVGADKLFGGYAHTGDQ